MAIAPIFYFICEHFLFVNIVKQKQTKISWIFKKFLSNFVRGTFLKIRSSKNLPCTLGCTKKLDPIGSAVLTYIEYKQTEHLDMQSLYIDVELLKQLR